MSSAHGLSAQGSLTDVNEGLKEMRAPDSRVSASRKR